MKPHPGWLILIIGFLATGPAPLAAQSPPKLGIDLTRLVRPGDVISATDWSGTTVKAVVAEVAPCSLVVEADEGLVEIDADRLKVVRRHERAAPTTPPGRIADAGRRCADPGCMAVSLAFKTGTGVKRGFQKLFRRPEVVYRARTESSERLPCTA